MVTDRQLRKVVEDAGYKVVSLTTANHYKMCVKDNRGKTIKLVVSKSPRSQSHWPYFVLADIKRKMR